MKVKNCECCMMPLSKDPKNSGSEKYCSYCFVGGKLLAEGMSLKQFQEKSYQGMVEHGMNRIMAKLFSYMIRFAPYWRKK